MKKIAFLFVFIFCFQMSYGQKVKNENIPLAVKDAFQVLYPNADKVNWGKEGQNYEASLKMDGKEISVVFDSAGKLLGKEEDIEISELPANAREYLSKSFPKSKIREVEKKTNAQGIIIYEVEIKGKELIFDANGNFVKETKD
ncbi:PepSY-like domain-containing protein [Thermoflexibacter ruber]|uniref:Putative beta-lactamase-inhibitor-like, PepSY-like n=1 Tax=Thermoflexibacter ruber TaxID=1003 RepID=A0A1I2INT0_9BACT|nr:PepSY-like domain-containing protein [Thermoflexibacter ruber]SFF42486.1 Putative beta-lactamase-inhibitor-like, PepSY-like [Thermoflexibacter ruber]